MKQYKVISATEQDFNETLNNHIKDGYEMVGGITASTKGSVVYLFQLAYKEIEVVVAPIAKSRKKK